jgi:hypothetical protein
MQGLSVNSGGDSEEDDAPHRRQKRSHIEFKDPFELE